MTGIELRHVRMEGELYVHRDDLVRLILGVSKYVAHDPEIPSYVRPRVATAFDQLGMSIAMIQVDDGPN